MPFNAHTMLFKLRVGDGCDHPHILRLKHPQNSTAHMERAIVESRHVGHYCPHLQRQHDRDVREVV